ncbi:uncharacterized protein LOC131215222 [Anopheles bellator]|uniref:uncharacterized protein LOC131215222 n=1 Tax=Anopheles bellator TaxID=139047 RepID=UPI002649ABB0|nr:uncharacterized protein LOC131215222 [Anopheles bellator]
MDIPKPAPITAKVYLSREEILGKKLYTCLIENCHAVFHNASHLQMHTVRRHKTTANLEPATKDSVDVNKHFYCPWQNCPYFQTPLGPPNDARHFLSFRSLKQHALKVHEVRTHVCTDCGKSFATHYFLKHHQQSCGKSFICAHCPSYFGSREALLTHAKRKQHGYEELLATKLPRANTNSQIHNAVTTQQKANENKAVSTATQTIVDVTMHQDQATQTVESSKQPANHVSGASSLPVAFLSAQHLIGASEFPIPVVCTETQTDFIDVMLANAGENRHDPLLSYTHMCTQTSDEPGLFSDLGLSTIETQTCWSEDGDGATFGDFLVSTETQTNFDIDSFGCTDSYCPKAGTGDRNEVPPKCKQTQAPETLPQGFQAPASCVDFLSDGDTLDCPSQTS